MELKANLKYRFITNLHTIMDNFQKNDIVLFIKKDYSRYDNATIYLFEELDNRVKKQAFIQDDDNIDIFNFLKEEE